MGDLLVLLSARLAARTSRASYGRVGLPKIPTKYWAAGMVNPNSVRIIRIKQDRRFPRIRLAMGDMIVLELYM